MYGDFFSILFHVKYWLLAGRQYKVMRKTLAQFMRGHVVEQLVVALRYKLKGHGFDSWWGNLLKPSGRTVTQPVTEMSTRGISWGVKTARAKGWQPYRLHMPVI
jgi:hypothetical protein